MSAKSVYQVSIVSIPIILFLGSARIYNVQKSLFFSYTVLSYTETLPFFEKLSVVIGQLIHERSKKKQPVTIKNCSLKKKARYDLLHRSDDRNSIFR